MCGALQVTRADLIRDPMETRECTKGARGVSMDRIGRIRNRASGFSTHMWKVALPIALLGAIAVLVNILRWAGPESPDTFAVNDWLRMAAGMFLFCLFMPLSMASHYADELDKRMRTLESEMAALRKVHGDDDPAASASP